ncbi:MAG: YtzI protein [Bacillus sp. (in: Bacteria)]|nr:YtzI protein [Bacillus sp. (in: firmicutes)]
MFTVLVISLIIIVLVLILSIVSTSKAYSFKHSVDPLENNPYLNQKKKKA